VLQLTRPISCGKSISGAELLPAPYYRITFTREVVAEGTGSVHTVKCPQRAEILGKVSFSFFLSINFSSHIKIKRSLENMTKIWQLKISGNVLQD
jgi:hypothetical protein